MDKVTLVITVLNEEETLPKLFASIEKQTLSSFEVIIVDGGSTDKTLDLLKHWYPRFPYRFIQKTGNRSVGRNAGIEIAKYPIIAITDAGCELEEGWLEHIVFPFNEKDTEVVAGYYKAKAATPFQHAAACYMLVMPEHVDPNSFLPATRSMAFLKSTWQKIGTFPEEFSNNEDYVFAHALRKGNATMVFQETARVCWTPPSTWKSFARQIYRFAYGDMYAGIVRPKIVLIYVRYIVFLFLAKISFSLFFIAVLAYLLWAFWKNHKHVSLPHAYWLLPIFQLLTDLLVMVGSLHGLIVRAISKKDVV